MSSLKQALRTYWSHRRLQWQADFERRYDEIRGKMHDAEVAHLQYMFVIGKTRYIEILRIDDFKHKTQNDILLLRASGFFLQMWRKSTWGRGTKWNDVLRVSTSAAFVCYVSHLHMGPN